MIEYGLILLTGALTSLHCVGMCGAIVLAYSVQPISETISTHKQNGFLLHTAYNGGRILSYAVLGAVAGIIGMTFSWIEQIGQYVSMIGGGIMIISGFALLGFIPITTRISLGSSIFRKLQASLLHKKTIHSKLLLGFLTPLLPCGILYAILAKAAATGNAIGGAITMSLFSIGMAPSLMLLGSVSSFFSSRVRKGAEQLAAIAIIIMGIILILRGLHIPFLSIFTNEANGTSCCTY